MKKIYIDLETTGTDPVRNGVIQIAGIIEIPDKEDVTFNYFLKPFTTDDIEEEAMKVNGKMLLDVATYPEPVAVHQQFIRLLDTYIDRFDQKDKFLFYGYNALFDSAMLRQWMQKCGNGYYGSYFWHPPIDTMNFAMRVLADERHELPNFKLATVAEYIGINLSGRDLHDAMTDIQVTREIEDKLFLMTI